MKGKPLFGAGIIMKKGWKRTVIIAAVVVAAVAAYFIYSAVTANAEQDALFETTPSTDVVTRGDISLTVSGSGNLGSAETIEIETDSIVIIDEVLVDAGDTIAADEVVATLDIEAMSELANALEEQIQSIQTSIDTTNSVTTSLSIKSMSDGWVKNVMLDEDEYIEDAMDEYGYVALVATEARELIDAEGSGLVEGDTVKVKCEGRSYTGTVTSENGGLHVSIDTIYRTVGAEAVVYDADGNALFTGAIELAAHDVIESSFGIITDVKFSEDNDIEQGETIYEASQYSLEVQALFESLADAKEEYADMIALIESGQITAPSTGVVTSVSVKDGQTCEEDTMLMAVESTDAWLATVAVDELDINAIVVGQSVEVSLDSMPNDVFAGEVVAISDSGIASGGITTYDVDVSVEDNDGFKLAMTLNCEIVAQEVTDAVLAPVDAVRTSKTQSYVMVAVERTEDETAVIKQLITDNDYTGLIDYMGDDAAALGIMRLTDPSELLYAEVRAIEIGIQDAFYVQIISGLSEGETILLAGSDDDAAEMMPGMMQGMMQGMGEGTGQRPERPAGAGGK